MKFGKIKKLIACIALSATVACVAATASGCSAETKHPEVRITYEFNGKKYSVEYTLYRNMYPNTVRHFLELTEKGFYNNTVIHDMESNDWFGGAYEYVADLYAEYTDNGAEAMKEYYETYSKEQAYYDLFNAGKLTKTVYERIAYKGQTQIIEKSSAKATLIGEFSDNQHVIENGALTADYGCLKMYYTTRQTKKKVYITPSSSQIAFADYSKNCATYVFGMQVGTTSTYVASKYCVFATVKDDSKVEKLVSAVEDYNRENYENTDSYLQPLVDVDTLDKFDEEKDGNLQETFRSPKTAVIIKSVKIIKY